MNEAKKREAMDREHKTYLKDEKERAALEIAEADVLEALLALQGPEEWKPVAGLISRAIDMASTGKTAQAAFALASAMGVQGLAAWQRGHIVRIVHRMDGEKW